MLSLNSRHYAGNIFVVGRGFNLSGAFSDLLILDDFVTQSFPSAAEMER